MQIKANCTHVYNSLWMEIRKSGRLEEFQVTRNEAGGFMYVGQVNRAKELFKVWAYRVGVDTAWERLDDANQAAWLEVCEANTPPLYDEDDEDDEDEMRERCADLVEEFDGPLPAALRKKLAAAIREIK